MTLLLVALALGSARSAIGQENKLDALRSSASSAPADAGAALLLGRALRRAGRYTEALTELRRGLATSEGRSGKIGAELAWELSRVYIDDHKFREALAACAKLATMPDAAALGHACNAWAHMIRKRATDALPEAELALQKNPSLYEARVAMADALVLEGDAASARTELIQAIAGGPARTEAYLRLGGLEEVQGNREAALAAYEKARSVDSDDAEAALALGRLLPAGERAAQALQAAVAARPSLGAAWARLADVQMTLGQITEAEKAALSALKLDGKQAEWHVILARVYAAEKRYDDALKEARGALALVSNMAAAKLVEADVLAEQGEIDAALAGYQAAFGLSRSDPNPLVHAARACLARGRVTSARGFAERATELFPKWAPAWAVLGDALARDKEPASARKAYATALSSEGLGDRGEVEKKLNALK